MPIWHSLLRRFYAEILEGEKKKKKKEKKKKEKKKKKKKNDYFSLDLGIFLKLKFSPQIDYMILVESKCSRIEKTFGGSISSYV